MKVRLSQYRIKLKDRFFRYIETKNSWGKNEIMKAYIEIESNIIDEMIAADEKEETD